MSIFVRPPTKSAGAFRTPFFGILHPLRGFRMTRGEGGALSDFVLRDSSPPAGVQDDAGGGGKGRRGADSVWWDPSPPTGVQDDAGDGTG